MLTKIRQQRRSIFQRGLRRGLSRGLSLFGALLALALMGMLVLAAATFFETLAGERRARIAARQLTVLADAAASHVHGRFPELLAAARGGPVEITLAQLKGAGSLPPDFPGVDALGRGYRVLILAEGADAIDVLAAETIAAGDTVPPSAALFEAAGEARLGLVAPDAPSRLAGPIIDYDIGAFQAAFAGAPAVGALAALRRFDHGAVFGGRLQRLAVPGFPAANRMETDLDMGGNAITGAGELAAESLDLSGDLEAGGDILVSGDLTVGNAVRVAGTIDAAGAIGADTASFAGAVMSGSMTVNGALRGRKHRVHRRRHGRLARRYGNGHRRQRQSRDPHRQHGDGPHGDGRHSVRRFRQGHEHSCKRAPRCGHGRVQHPHRRPVHGVQPMKTQFKTLVASTLLIGAAFTVVLVLPGAADTRPRRRARTGEWNASPAPKPAVRGAGGPHERRRGAAGGEPSSSRRGLGQGARLCRDGTPARRDRDAERSRRRAERASSVEPRADQDRRGPGIPAGAPLPAIVARRLVPVAAGHIRRTNAKRRQTTNKG